MRHRHEGAADVGEVEKLVEEHRIVLGLHAHRHDDRVDALAVEPGVVDEGRLEGLGRIAHVGDEDGLAADHVSS